MSGAPNRRNPPRGGGRRGPNHNITEDLSSPPASPPLPSPADGGDSRAGVPHGHRSRGGRGRGSRGRGQSSTSHESNNAPNTTSTPANDTSSHLSSDRGPASSRFAADHRRNQPKRGNTANTNNTNSNDNDAPSFAQSNEEEGQSFQAAPFRDTLMKTIGLGVSTYDDLAAIGFAAVCSVLNVENKSHTSRSHRVSGINNNTDDVADGERDEASSSSHPNHLEATLLGILRAQHSPWSTGHGNTNDNDNENENNSEVNGGESNFSSPFFDRRLFAEKVAIFASAARAVPPSKEERSPPPSDTPSEPKTRPTTPVNPPAAAAAELPPPRRVEGEEEGQGGQSQSEDGGEDAVVAAATAVVIPNEQHIQEEEEREAEGGSPLDDSFVLVSMPVSASPLRNASPPTTDAEPVLVPRPAPVENEATVVAVPQEVASTKAASPVKKKSAPLPPSPTPTPPSTSSLSAPLPRPASPSLLPTVSTSGPDSSLISAAPLLAAEVPPTTTPPDAAVVSTSAPDADATLAATAVPTAPAPEVPAPPVSTSSLSASAAADPPPTVPPSETAAQPLLPLSSTAVETATSIHAPPAAPLRVSINPQWAALQSYLNGLETLPLQQQCAAAGLVSYGTADEEEGSPENVPLQSNDNDNSGSRKKGSRGKKQNRKNSKGNQRGAKDVNESDTKKDRDQEQESGEKDGHIQNANHDAAGLLEFNATIGEEPCHVTYSPEYWFPTVAFHTLFKSCENDTIDTDLSTEEKEKGTEVTTNTLVGTGQSKNPEDEKANENEKEKSPAADQNRKEKDGNLSEDRQRYIAEADRLLRLTYDLVVAEGGAPQHQQNNKSSGAEPKPSAASAKSIKQEQHQHPSLSTIAPRLLSYFEWFSSPFLAYFVYEDTGKLGGGRGRRSSFLSCASSSSCDDYFVTPEIECGGCGDNSHEDRDLKEHESKVDQQEEAEAANTADSSSRTRRNASLLTQFLRLETRCVEEWLFRLTLASLLFGSAAPTNDETDGDDTAQLSLPAYLTAAVDAENKSPQQHGALVQGNKKGVNVTSSSFAQFIFLSYELIRASSLLPSPSSAVVSKVLQENSITSLSSLLPLTVQHLSAVTVATIDNDANNNTTAAADNKNSTEKEVSSFKLYFAQSLMARLSQHQQREQQHHTTADKAEESTSSGGDIEGLIMHLLSADTFIQNCSSLTCTLIRVFLSDSLCNSLSASASPSSTSRLEILSTAISTILLEPKVVSRLREKDEDEDTAKFLLESIPIQYITALVREMEAIRTSEKKEAAAAVKKREVANNSKKSNPRSDRNSHADDSQSLSSPPTPSNSSRFSLSNLATTLLSNAFKGVVSHEQYKQIVDFWWSTDDKTGTSSAASAKAESGANNNERRKAFISDFLRSQSVCEAFELSVSFASDDTFVLPPLLATIIEDKEIALHLWTECLLVSDADGGKRSSSMFWWLRYCSPHMLASLLLNVVSSCGGASDDSLARAIDIGYKVKYFHESPMPSSDLLGLKLPAVTPNRRVLQALLSSGMAGERMVVMADAQVSSNIHNANKTEKQHRLSIFGWLWMASLRSLLAETVIKPSSPLPPLFFGPKPDENTKQVSNVARAFIEKINNGRGANVASSSTPPMLLLSDLITSLVFDLRFYSNLTDERLKGSIMDPIKSIYLNSSEKIAQLAAGAREGGQVGATEKDRYSFLFTCLRQLHDAEVTRAAKSAPQGCSGLFTRSQDIANGYIKVITVDYLNILSEHRLRESHENLSPLFSLSSAGIDTLRKMESRIEELKQASSSVREKMRVAEWLQLLPFDILPQNDLIRAKLSGLRRAAVASADASAPAVAQQQMGTTDRGYADLKALESKLEEIALLAFSFASPSPTGAPRRDLCLKAAERYFFPREDIHASAAVSSAEEDVKTVGSVVAYALFVSEKSKQLQSPPDAQTSLFGTWFASAFTRCIDFLQKPTSDSLPAPLPSFNTEDEIRKLTDMASVLGWQNYSASAGLKNALDSSFIRASVEVVRNFLNLAPPTSFIVDASHWDSPEIGNTLRECLTGSMQESMLAVIGMPELLKVTEGIMDLIADRDGNGDGPHSLSTSQQGGGGRAASSGTHIDIINTGKELHAQLEGIVTDISTDTEDHDTLDNYRYFVRLLVALLLSNNDSALPSSPAADAGLSAGEATLLERRIRFICTPELYDGINTSAAAIETIKLHVGSLEDIIRKRGADSEGSRVSNFVKSLQAGNAYLRFVCKHKARTLEIQLVRSSGESTTYHESGDTLASLVNSARVYSPKDSELLSKAHNDMVRLLEPLKEALWYGYDVSTISQIALQYASGAETKHASVISEVQNDIESFLKSARTNTREELLLLPNYIANLIRKNDGATPTHLQNVVAGFLRAFLPNKSCAGMWDAETKDSRFWDSVKTSRLFKMMIPAPPSGQFHRNLTKVPFSILGYTVGPSLSSSSQDDVHVTDALGLVAHQTVLPLQALFCDPETTIYELQRFLTTLQKYPRIKYFIIGLECVPDIMRRMFLSELLSAQSQFPSLLSALTIIADATSDAFSQLKTADHQHVKRADLKRILASSPASKTISENLSPACTGITWVMGAHGSGKTLFARSVVPPVTPLLCSGDTIGPDDVFALVSKLSEGNNNKSSSPVWINIDQSMLRPSKSRHGSSYTYSALKLLSINKTLWSLLIHGYAENWRGEVAVLPTNGGSKVSFVVELPPISDSYLYDDFTLRGTTESAPTRDVLRRSSLGYLSLATHSPQLGSSNGGAPTEEHICTAGKESLIAVLSRFDAVEGATNGIKGANINIVSSRRDAELRSFHTACLYVASVLGTMEHAPNATAASRTAAATTMMTPVSTISAALEIIETVARISTPYHSFGTQRTAYTMLPTVEVLFRHNGKFRALMESLQHNIKFFGKRFPAVRSDQTARQNLFNLTRLTIRGAVDRWGQGSIVTLDKLAPFGTVFYADGCFVGYPHRTFVGVPGIPKTDNPISDIGYLARAIMGDAFGESIDILEQVWTERGIVTVPDTVVRMMCCVERQGCQAPMLVQGPTGVGKTFLIESLFNVQVRAFINKTELELASFKCNMIKRAFPNEADLNPKVASRSVINAKFAEIFHGAKLRRTFFAKEWHAFEDATLKDYPFLELPPVPEDLDRSKQPRDTFENPAAVVTFFERIRPKKTTFKLVIHPDITHKEILDFVDEAVAFAGSLMGGRDAVKCLIVPVFFDEPNTSLGCAGLLKSIMVDGFNPRTGQFFGSEYPLWFIGAINEASSHYATYVTHPSAEFNLCHFHNMAAQQQRTYISHLMKSNAMAAPCERKREAIATIVAALHEKCHSYFKDGSHRHAVSQRDVHRFVWLFETISVLIHKSNSAGVSTTTEASVSSLTVPAASYESPPDFLKIALVSIYYTYIARFPQKKVTDVSASAANAHIRERMADEFCSLLQQANILQEGEQCDMTLITRYRKYVVRSIVNATNFRLGEGVALTDTLCENIFATLLACMSPIHKKTPVAIIGDSGMGKTLSNRIVERNLKGDVSETAFCRLLPKAEFRYIQGASTTTPKQVDIVCSRAKEKQLKQPSYACAVCFDEASLTNRDALVHKSLHEPVDAKIISIIVLSNKPFDDEANQNRFLVVWIQSLEEEEVRELTQACIGPAANEALVKAFASAFVAIRTDKSLSALYQTRDYIFLLKYLRYISSASAAYGHGGARLLSPEEIKRGIEFNFGGPKREMLQQVLAIFSQKLVDCGSDAISLVPTPTPTILKESYTRADHLRALTRPRSVLVIVPSKTYFGCEIIPDLVKKGDVEVAEALSLSSLNEPDSCVEGTSGTHNRVRRITFGALPGDTSNEAEIRTLAELRSAMEDGAHVIIRNPLQLIGCLFDVLNLNYTVTSATCKNGSGKIQIERAIMAYGANTFKVRIHKNFRMTFIFTYDAISAEVSEGNAPFLSRTEKYLLEGPMIRLAMDYPQIHPTIVHERVDMFAKAIGYSSFAMFEPSITIPTAIMSAARSILAAASNNTMPISSETATRLITEANKLLLTLIRSRKRFEIAEAHFENPIVYLEALADHWRNTRNIGSILKAHAQPAIFVCSNDMKGLEAFTNEDTVDVDEINDTPQLVKEIQSRSAKSCVYIKVSKRASSPEIMWTIREIIDDILDDKEKHFIGAGAGGASSHSLRFVVLTDMNTAVEAGLDSMRFAYVVANKIVPAKTLPIANAMNDHDNALYGWGANEPNEAAGLDNDVEDDDDEETSFSDPKIFNDGVAADSLNFCRKVSKEILESLKSFCEELRNDTTIKDGAPLEKMKKSILPEALDCIRGRTTSDLPKILDAVNKTLSELRSSSMDDCRYREAVNIIPPKEVKNTIRESGGMGEVQASDEDVVLVERGGQASSAQDAVATMDFDEIDDDDYDDDF